MPRQSNNIFDLLDIENKIWYLRYITIYRDVSNLDAFLRKGNLCKKEQDTTIRQDITMGQDTIIRVIRERNIILITILQEGKIGAEAEVETEANEGEAEGIEAGR